MQLKSFRTLGIIMLDQDEAVHVDLVEATKRMTERE